MRIGTLFSGIGAPEQAVRRVYADNHEIVFACEWDKFARESYLANYDIDEQHFHKDINEMDGNQYKGKVDVIIGGSPCQDFSIAGLRAGIDGHRGQLIWQYYRIIKEIMPPVFIYENVKGMVSDKGGKTLKDFLEVFRGLGYGCYADVVNTKDYGVPQNRERVYIVGFLDDAQYFKFSFSEKMPLEKRLKDVLEDDVNEKYFLSDTAISGFIKHSERMAERGNGFKFEPTCGNVIASSITTKEGRRSCGNYIKIAGMLDIKSKDQIRRVYDTDGLSPTLTTMQGVGQEPKIKVQSATKKGYEIAEYGDSINLTHPKSKTRRGRVGKQVAQTLDCACNQAVVEERVRRLTPRECLRLQDFSDDFIQVVSDSQMYKQAGNSMSVNILEMILTQIQEAKLYDESSLFSFGETA